MPLSSSTTHLFLVRYTLPAIYHETSLPSKGSRLSHLPIHILSLSGRQRALKLARLIVRQHKQFTVPIAEVYPV